MTRYPPVWYCGQCGRVIPGTEVPDPDACCPRRRAAWADDGPPRQRQFIRDILTDVWLVVLLAVTLVADRAWKWVDRRRAAIRGWARPEPPCY